MFSTSKNLVTKLLVGALLFQTALPAYANQHTVIENIDDQPYESIPFLPAMTVAELKERVSRTFDQSSEIAEIRKFAKKRKIRFFLFGKTAVDALHAERIQSLSDLQQEENRNSKRSLNQLRRPWQHLKMAVVNQSGDCPSTDEIASLRAELAASFFEGFSPEMIGFRSLPQGQFQLEVDSESLTPLFDSFASAYVEITPKFNAFSGNWIGDLTGSIGSSPAFLESMASGAMTLKDFVPYLKLRMSQVSEHSVVDAIRLVGQKQRYGLEMDPSFLETLGGIFANLEPQELNDEAWKRVETEGKAVFTEGLDFEDTWNTLDYLTARQKLYRPDLQHQEEFSFFLCKEPLRSMPYPGAHLIREVDGINHHRTAEALGLSIINHHTKHPDAHQIISSHPANKVNGCISRHGHNDEKGKHGDGFYTAVGEYGDDRYGPLHVKMEISKRALQNVHFVKKGGFDGYDYCRLISSDPNFVRVLKHKNQPLYRPKTLPKKLIGQKDAFMMKCFNFLKRK